MQSILFVVIPSILVHSAVFAYLRCVVAGMKTRLASAEGLVDRALGDVASGFKKAEAAHAEFVSTIKTFVEELKSEGVVHTALYEGAKFAEATRHAFLEDVKGKLEVYDQERNRVLKLVEDQAAFLEEKAKHAANAALNLVRQCVSCGRAVHKYEITNGVVICADCKHGVKAR